MIKRITHKLPDISAASIIPASIEASPAQVLGATDLAGLFPQGVRVYLTDTGAASQEKLVEAAAHLRGLGYQPVPHLAARRIPSRAGFEEQVRRFAGEAGVTDVLVVGGGVDHAPRAVIEAPNRSHSHTVCTTSCRVFGMTTPNGMI